MLGTLASSETGLMPPRLTTRAPSPSPRPPAPQVEAAVRAGCQCVVLSDKAPMEETRPPIPPLLATGAVHHHLIRAGALSAEPGCAAMGGAACRAAPCLASRGHWSAPTPAHARPPARLLAHPQACAPTPPLLWRLPSASPRTTWPCWWATARTPSAPTSRLRRAASGAARRAPKT